MSDVPSPSGPPAPAGPWSPPSGNAPPEPHPAPGNAVPEPPATPRPAGLRSTDFLAAQRRNRRSTALLLVLLTAIAALLGYLLGAWLETTSNGPVPWPSEIGILFAAILAGGSLVWSWISLLWGDRMVLSMTGGRDVTKDEEPQLVNVVEELCLASGLPMPSIRVIETDAMNAFATALRTDRATIGITRGLLSKLNREELQGVIAHEMSHVANLDSRYMTVVGVTVGLIALIADMLLRSFNWGGLASNRRSGDRKGGGGGAAILLVILLVVAVLAPIAAKLVQFAVSRQREYLADATSVQFTRNPEGLISALQKLGAAAKPFPGVSQATQHLFIVNPLRDFTRDTPRLLATHPDIEDRIERLRNLG